MLKNTELDLIVQLRSKSLALRGISEQHIESERIKLFSKTGASTCLKHHLFTLPPYKCIACKHNN